MAFEDLKDRLSDEWAQTYARLQENSTFVQLQERYQSLPLAGQKGVLAGIAALIALFLFSMPWGMFSSSSEKIADFEEKKGLISEMFRVNRDRITLGTDRGNIDGSSLSNMIQGKIGDARLAAEQVRSIQTYQTKGGRAAGGDIPASVQQSGATVSLGHLNLTQLVDIGYMLQTIGAGVKMTGMEVNASAEKPGYFDVVYKLVVFSVPEPPKPPTKPGRARAGTGSSRSANEDGEG